jgi:spore coat protein U-like protein
VPSKRPVASFLAGLVVVLALAFGANVAVPQRAEAAAGCTASVGSVNFGTQLSPLSAGVVDATATVTFSCTGQSPLVALTLCPNMDSGSGGGDAAGMRRLVGPGGATVNFQIYQDSARTQPWGAAALLIFGTVPTITGTPMANGSLNVTTTLYARIWTTPTTPPGAYASAFAGQNFFWGLNLLSCAGVTIGYQVIPATFDFTATLIPDCKTSAPTLDFGTVGVLNADKTALAQLNLTCTSGTPYAIGLDNGQNGSGPTARRMKKGTEYVTYGIYRDSNRLQPWGGAGQTVAGSGTGVQVGVPVYGKVPAQATPSPGGYGDTVVATVTY